MPVMAHQTTATPLGLRVTGLFGEVNALFFDFLSVKWIVCHSYPRCHELLKPRGREQNRIVGAPAGRRGAGSRYSTAATPAQEMGVSQLYSGGEVFEQQFFRVTLVKVNGF